MKKVLLSLSLFACSLMSQAQVSTPSWNDAPSLYTANLGLNMAHYEFPSTLFNVGVDLSWKYVYLGIDLAVGKTDGFTESAYDFKLGTTLPINFEKGFSLAITPYVAVGPMSYSKGGVVSSDFCVGPGIKVNYIMPSKFAIGAFFHQLAATDEVCNNTYNTAFGISIGRTF